VLTSRFVLTICQGHKPADFNVIQGEVIKKYIRNVDYIRWLLTCLLLYIVFRETGIATLFVIAGFTVVSEFEVISKRRSRFLNVGLLC